MCGYNFVLVAGFVAAGGAWLFAQGGLGVSGLSAGLLVGAAAVVLWLGVKESQTTQL